MTSPTLVNSYGSAKHTVINSNGQSVVYWNPLKISGTIEGVTWENKHKQRLKVSFLGCLQSILGLQYQDTAVEGSTVVTNVTVKLIVKVAFGVSASVRLTFVSSEDTILTSWGIPIKDYVLGGGNLTILIIIHFLLFRREVHLIDTNLRQITVVRQLLNIWPVDYFILFNLIKAVLKWLQIMVHFVVLVIQYRQILFRLWLRSTLVFSS